jgi:hypothetical protein
MIASLGASPFAVPQGPTRPTAPIIFHSPSAPVEISPAPVSAMQATPIAAPTSIPASASATSAPAAAVSSSSSSSSSSAAPAAAALPELVSGIIDPVTNVSYSGYLTPDAQTLFQSGSLLTGGNILTPQGSALAAQGDLITGTPAPTAAQIAAATSAVASAATTAAAGTAAAASTTSDTWTQITNWLSEETLFAGVPNGAIAAGGIIVAAMFFGGGKKRR